MDIIIKNSSSQPIYEQIYSQIKDMILNGSLTEGEMLPSIRGLEKNRGAYPGNPQAGKKLRPFRR